MEILFILPWPIEVLTNTVYPVENAMVGGEFQWGRRQNVGDGFHSDDYRIQISFRYNFSKTFSF